MIKLNNKKITYVALADTNNSLKAPKEIWYADSNNSVKLVYRRKDALIEGEDYEKYHWLVGDGSAYIDTLISDLTNVKNIYCKIKRPSDVSGISSQRVFGRENPSGYSGTRFVIRPYDNHLGLYTSTTVYTLSTDDDDYINIDAESNTASTSQQSKTIEDIKTNGISLCLFGDHTSLSNFSAFYISAFYKGSIGEFTIDGTINLIPCKLLKPVPKWLDANGIRRQVGECGMIDLVSGKFYGNVANAGTFSVENYYERKEWLVGDIPSETLCIDLPINSEEVSYTIVVSKVGNTTLFETIGNKRYYAYAPSSTLRIWDITTSKSDSNDGKIDLGIQDGVILNIDSDISSFKINNIDCPKVNFPISAIIFRSGGLQSNTITQTSSITVNDKERYIPCILTMDLPASMDANNIARTKGTSGMWDLVSDRFYGNVANSGTFKAVNLAEGVDYEVHQWLKTGSRYPHIQVAYNYNTDSGAYIETRYKCNYSNKGFDMFIGFSINQNNNIGIRIFNAENKTFVDHHKTENGVLSSSRIIKSQSNINAERYIKATLNNLIIDDTEYPTINWGSGFNAINRRGTILYTNQGDNDVHYAETKLRVNNVEYDLIPVKLLKSIPAKYDANGIARNAGECGMYDTVNDVFYGNVASSGTFSVSDDS